MFLRRVKEASTVVLVVCGASYRKTSNISRHANH